MDGRTPQILPNLERPRERKRKKESLLLMAMMGEAVMWHNCNWWGFPSSLLDDGNPSTVSLVPSFMNGEPKGEKWRNLRLSIPILLLFFSTPKLYSFIISSSSSSSGIFSSSQPPNSSLFSSPSDYWAIIFLLPALLSPDSFSVVNSLFPFILFFTSGNVQVVPQEILSV